MELLYIIRNSEKDNHSILGVYTSAKAAKKAIEYNENLLLKQGCYKHGDLEALANRRKGEDITFIPYKEVKVVLANGIQYRGCSAYSVNFLLKDPEEFERRVKEWFEANLTWAKTVDDIA